MLVVDVRLHKYGVSLDSSAKPLDLELEDSLLGFQVEDAGTFKEFIKKLQACSSEVEKELPAPVQKAKEQATGQDQDSQHPIVKQPREKEVAKTDIPKQATV